uniref:Uncharacterized protein n=1 Tax=Alexandrium monilatum TaxID=311494 RepID=A0A7S4QXC3_9DINO
MAAPGSPAGGRPDWSSLAAAALAFSGRGLGQPVCNVVGPNINPTCGRGWGEGSLWPSAFIYHSLMSGPSSPFLEVPSPEGQNPQVSIAGLTAMPASDFLRVLPGSARSWANSAEGEWTASLQAGRALLHVGGGTCLLAGVSVYRPERKRLALRLNFDGCSSACRVRHVGVELPLRRAASGGCAGVLVWMCGVMPAGTCPPSASSSSGAEAVRPALDLACELGSPSCFRAVRRRMQAVAAGCYEAFDWITPEPGLHSHGSLPEGGGAASAGASLGINATAWDLLMARLPVLSTNRAIIAAPLVHSTVLADRICVSIGGGCSSALGNSEVAGGDLGVREPWAGIAGVDIRSYVASEWWKWLLIAVLSSTFSILSWQAYTRRERTIDVWAEELQAGQQARRLSGTKIAYSLVPHRPFWD